MSKFLWLVRHGESQGNLEQRIQGSDDSPLTDLGRQQARLVAARLVQETQLSEIISSSLSRAVETGEIISQTLSLPLRFDPRLNEYNFGPLNGLTREEIARRYPEVPAAWKANEFWEPLPGEEGDPAFEARVRLALDELIEGMAEETAVAVVTHGGVLNACLRAALGIIERGWRTFAFDNASVSLLQIQASARAAASGKSRLRNYRLLLLNDISHVKEIIRVRPTWFGSRRIPLEQMLPTSEELANYPNFVLGWLEE
jgi:broad specificity phosphatase PhoE